jgi:hypothetical protein
MQCLESSMNTLSVLNLLVSDQTGCSDLLKCTIFLFWGRGGRDGRKAVHERHSYGLIGKYMVFTQLFLQTRLKYHNQTQGIHVSVQSLLLYITNNLFIIPYECMNRNMLLLQHSIQKGLVCGGITIYINFSLEDISSL